MPFEPARMRLPALVDDLVDRQRREVPELFVSDDSALTRAVRRSTQENVEQILDALRRPGALPHALGPGPRLEADVAAHHGAPIAALLRTYRLGQQVFAELLMDELGGEPLRIATRTLYEYTEAVMPLVATEYREECARLEADPELRRLRPVQAVLAGQDAVAGLEHPLAGPHLAVVSQDARARAALTAAGVATGAATLVLRTPDGACWGWLATRAPGTLAEHLRAAGVEGPTGLGGPDDGPGGFRAAHRQARIAERVARSRGGGIVSIRDAALEALALGDADTARLVARVELGRIAEPDARAARLRETLEAWFGAHERLAETAATLGVAPRTVTYRLRRAEALLGCSLADRRAELETALRLHRLLAFEDADA